MADGTLTDDIMKAVFTSKALEKVQEMTTKNTNEQMQKRTGRLWIQYMEMVSLMRQFIKAERTGDWNLHLQSVKQMLPYYAAAGHNNYLKSSYIYLQNMLNLKNTHPNVEKLFQSGYHVIRKSHRFWAGRSADLVIEQDYMRCMKSSGIYLPFFY